MPRRPDRFAADPEDFFGDYQDPDPEEREDDEPPAPIRGRHRGERQGFLDRVRVWTRRR